MLRQGSFSAFLNTTDDKGDTFTPDFTHGATTMAGGAYDGTAPSNYNTNSVTHTVSYEYMNGGTAVAYLNVHFGGVIFSHKI